MNSLAQLREVVDSTFTNDDDDSLDLTKEISTLKMVSMTIQQQSLIFDPGWYTTALLKIVYYIRVLYTVKNFEGSNFQNLRFSD